jgi:hypothetical protein
MSRKPKAGDHKNLQPQKKMKKEEKPHAKFAFVLVHFPCAYLLEVLGLLLNETEIDRHREAADGEIVVLHHAAHRARLGGIGEVARLVGGHEMTLVVLALATQMLIAGGRLTIPRRRRIVVAGVHRMATITALLRHKHIGAPTYRNQGVREAEETERAISSSWAHNATHCHVVRVAKSQDIAAGNTTRRRCALGGLRRGNHNKYIPGVDSNLHDLGRNAEADLYKVDAKWVHVTAHVKTL